MLPCVLKFSFVKNKMKLLSSTKIPDVLYHSCSSPCSVEWERLADFLQYLQRPVSVETEEQHWRDQNSMLLRQGSRSFAKKKKKIEIRATQSNLKNLYRRRSGFESHSAVLFFLQTITSSWVLTDWYISMKIMFPHSAFRPFYVRCRRWSERDVFLNLLWCICLMFNGRTKKTNTSNKFLTFYQHGINGYRNIHETTHLWKNRATARAARTERTAASLATRNHFFSLDVAFV